MCPSMTFDRVWGRFLVHLHEGETLESLTKKVIKKSWFISMKVAFYDLWGYILYSITKVFNKNVMNESWLLNIKVISIDFEIKYTSLKILSLIESFDIIRF